MSQVVLWCVHTKRLPKMHAHTSQRRVTTHCRQEKAGACTSERNLQHTETWTTGTRADQVSQQSCNAAPAWWAQVYQIAFVHNSSQRWSPLTVTNTTLSCLKRLLSSGGIILPAFLLSFNTNSHGSLQHHFSIVVPPWAILQSQYEAGSYHCCILDIPGVVFFLFLFLGTRAQQQHCWDEAKQLDKGKAHAHNAHNVEPLHDPQVELAVAAPLVYETRILGSGACCAIDELLQAAWLGHPLFVRPRRDTVPVAVAVDTATLKLCVNLVPKLSKPIITVWVVFVLDAHLQFLH